jgi:predicted nucleic acid-binding protein
MNGNRFIDSNIWLYAMFEPAEGEIAKRERAAALISEWRPTCVSEQVIAEVCANLLRRKVCSENELLAYVESFYRRCRVITPGESLHRDASGLRQRYALSYWDSLIVAAAVQSDCEVLHSEDMQHGLKIDRLIILNPFRS